MQPEILTTIKQALEWTREMWAWLAQNPVAAKSQWPGWATRQQCSSACACCEITKRSLDSPVNCERCPLLRLWQNGSTERQLFRNRVSYPCVDLENSVYARWNDAGTAGDWALRQNLAQIISDAADRELKESSCVPQEAVIDFSI